MIGGGGHNTLIAHVGNNLMVGGSGETIMVSGAGNDTMIGGSGNDTFVFNSSTGGRDTVMNFHDGDILQIQKNINGLNIDSAHDVASHVTDVHGNAVITLGNEQITLLGVKAEDVQHNPNGFIIIH